MYYNVENVLERDGDYGMSRMLPKDAPNGPVSLMYRFYRHVLPETRAQLDTWRTLATQIPDKELRSQALASINSKQFHCEGGTIYAVADLANRHILIPLIVAFQTISDYLDNLCDRSTSMDGDNFRRLHQSMLDAVNPSAVPAVYYEYHPEQDDNGYLTLMVRTCQTCICLLPNYDKVQHYVTLLVGLYCDLQVYKHIDPSQREKALDDWWSKHKEGFPGLHWNEFSAATGSTLGVFTLFLAAAQKELSFGEARELYEAYFPYICSLHILLDYLIDQQEDTEGGDLNFCRYYQSPDEAAERIGYIATQAKERVKLLRAPRFHGMIVEGLQAMYLTDPKVNAQHNVRLARRIIMKNSPLSRLFFQLFSIWVRKSQYNNNNQNHNKIGAE
jgi:tetraprenyl-beta-curcumene synthase